MGIDSKTVVRRLASEALVKKYLKKLMDDATYSQLIRAMEEEEYDVAFRAAHTLKGLCLNLGLEPLGEISSQMTELLRAPNRDPIGAQAQLAEVSAAYLVTIEKIALIS